MEWRTSVPRKRPNHSRCCGKEPYYRTPEKYEDNHRHDSCTCFASAVVEHLDERETSLCILQLLSASMVLQDS